MAFRLDLCLFCFLFFMIVLQFEFSLGVSNHYYTMVEDIENGIFYYKILELTPDAGLQDIKKSYRKFALK